MTRQAYVAALLLAAAGVSLSPAPATAAARLKDLVDVQGVRDYDLFGYGLVVGLNGTGDSERALFTQQSLAGVLGRMGLRVDPLQVKARNVAAVMVTARLSSFTRAGTRIDVAVASLGNARSLSGGTLLLTSLSASDGHMYATAQGPIQVGGYEASGGGASVSKNTPTSGRVPAGATVERVAKAGPAGPTVILALRRPDFTTANRIANVVNKALGERGAHALDNAAVEVVPPEAFRGDMVGLLAKLEVLEVEADERARVVISERIGTVVAGEHVRIRPVVISYGGLQVSITSQPASPGKGRGAAPTPPQASASASEESRAAVTLPATTTVQDLAKALNSLGASARDLVTILQAMKAAGALEADLEVL